MSNHDIYVHVVAHALNDIINIPKVNTIDLTHSYENAKEVKLHVCMTDSSRPEGDTAS